MSKKKIVIIITVIIAIIISVGVAVTYKNINTTKKLEEFNEYIEEYKTDIGNYIIDQHKEKYDELISKSNELLNNKDIDNIDNLKEKFKKLKYEIIQANLEIINSSISELEAIDLSKLEEKELIEEKVTKIKNLKENHKFIEANELSISLKEYINKKIESVKLEEEKKKVEEEAKKLKEERKISIANISDKNIYENIEVNQNKVIIGRTNIILKVINDDTISFEFTRYYIKKGFDDEGEPINREIATKKQINASGADGGIHGNGEFKYVSKNTWEGYIGIDAKNSFGHYGFDETKYRYKLTLLDDSIEIVKLDNGYGGFVGLYRAKLDTIKYDIGNVIN